MSGDHVFHLWRKTIDGQTLPVGTAAIDQAPNGRIQACQFRYSSRYLESAHCIAVDPHNLPLREERFNFKSDGHAVLGVLDDCLPGHWGRKIIGQRLGTPYPSIPALLANQIGASVGAMRVVPATNPPTEPVWPKSIPLAELENVVDAGWEADWDALAGHEYSLAVLAAGSSNTGGARPKILAHADSKEWIVKFNRSNDPFDMAAAEWASLEVCRQAGLPTPATRLGEIAGRRFLMVERFDIAPEGGRRHLVSLNALLKESGTLSDPIAGTYEAIVQQIRHHSLSPAEDVEILLGQILINGMLSNTDDHLRNFSLIESSGGRYRLSPVYDIVPGETLGGMHQLSFAGSPYLPAVESAKEAARSLGVPSIRAQEIQRRVKAAADEWPELLGKAGAPDKDRRRLETQPARNKQLATSRRPKGLGG